MYEKYQILGIAGIIILLLVSNFASTPEMSQGEQSNDVKAMNGNLTITNLIGRGSIQSQYNY